MPGRRGGDCGKRVAEAGGDTTADCCCGNTASALVGAGATRPRLPLPPPVSGGRLRPAGSAGEAGLVCCPSPSRNCRRECRGRLLYSGRIPVASRPGEMVWPKPASRRCSGDCVYRLLRGEPCWPATIRVGGVVRRGAVPVGRSQARGVPGLKTGTRPTGSPPPVVNALDAPPNFDSGGSCTGRGVASGCFDSRATAGILPCCGPRPAARSTSYLSRTKPSCPYLSPGLKAAS